MVKVESRVTRDVESKRSILATLAVFVLLSSSFTFSSCNGCKDENKGKDGDKASSDAASRIGENTSSSTPKSQIPKSTPPPSVSVDAMKEAARNAVGPITTAAEAADRLCCMGDGWGNADVNNFITAIRDMYVARKKFAIEMRENGTKTAKSNSEKAKVLEAEQKMESNAKGRHVLDTCDSTLRESWNELKDAMPDADTAWKELLKNEEGLRK
jgi:hypothetical protein